MDELSSALSVIARAASRPTECELTPAERWFVDQVEASRSDAVSMAQWTSSTVIDDNLQAPVFDEQTFSWLHGGVPGDHAFPIGHAGLMHTYGYLLSSVVTPYGLKRERWLTPDLAAACGHDPSFLFPTSSTVPLMERVAALVLPLLTDPVSHARTVAAFDEVVDARRRMRTVYVSDPESGSTAVVYGAITGSVAQIVSTFPVQLLTRDAVLARVGEPTRYRYNYAPPDAPPASGFAGTTQVLALAL